MLEIAIIADDLTGASDAAAGFARAGHSAAVVLELGAALRTAAAVVAIDTESRALSPAEAASRVARATRAVAAAPILMKKMDSTLRGPFGHELKAALSESGRTTAVVAPAFPTYGRTTRSGVQLVDGVPVDRTSMSRDPVAPVASSDVIGVLAQSGCLPTASMTLDVLRHPEAASTLLTREGFVVVDIESEADLRVLVRAVARPEHVLWVGSTGLARALGRLRPADAPHAAEPSLEHERVLIVVGSLNPLSRTQLALAQREFDATRFWLAAPDAALREEPGSERVLTLASVAPTDAGGRLADPVAMAETLAAAAERLVATRSVDALVVTGGHTAIAVIRRLGATGITPFAEAAAGMPIGRLDGPRPLGVVTKAGGFGEAGALVAAAGALTRAGALR